MNGKPDLIGLQRAFVGESVDRLLELRWAAFEDRQVFHGPEHSIVDLPTNGRRSLKYMFPDEFGEWFPLVKIGMAGHDWLQGFTVGRTSGGTVEVRIRDRGTNEFETARLVEQRLHELNPQYGYPLLPEHIRWIREGIEFTYPEFDAQLGTVFQPYLHAALTERTAHPVSIIIAMSDLAAAGGDWNLMLRGVFGLIQEEQIEIAKAVREAPRRSAIIEADQERYRQAIVGFLCAQPRFLSGRKQMFLKEVALLAHPDYLGPAAGQTMLDRFNQFDRNITLAERLAARCDSLSFWEVIELTGFRDYPID